MKLAPFEKNSPSERKPIRIPDPIRSVPFRSVPAIHPLNAKQSALSLFQSSEIEVNQPRR